MPSLAELLSVEVLQDVLNANFGDRILKHVITGTALKVDPEGCQEMIDRYAGKSYHEVQEMMKEYFGKKA